MSPWIIGFSVFIVYPMVSSLYFSFTHYDLLGSPIWIGLDNYKYMFTEGPSCSGRRSGTRCGSSWSRCRCRSCSRIFTASLLTRPRRGVKVYRTLFFLPAIAPVVAGALAFLFLLQPGVRPGQPVPARPIGIGDPPLVVLRPDLVEVGARDPRRCGGSATR